MKSLAAISIVTALFFHGNAIAANTCLYVSSYHAGYEWDDGIYSAIKKTLGDQCKLEIFYLDSKRNPKPEWIEWRAREAMKMIKRLVPDVIIAADDNASRYLVMPYLKDNKIPVVFCGVNWSMDEYGYPYKNTTGMIEISPIRPMIKQLKALSPEIKTGVFLSSNTASEHKDYHHYKKKFFDNGIKLDSVFVSNFRDWIESFKDAQKYDFIFLGNNAGINDWYKPEAVRIVDMYAKKISISSYKWMLPYISFAFTKLPEEQGNWAASVALSILNGADPGQIPVVYNRLWDIWMNMHIISRVNIDIPYLLYRRAKHF